MNLLKIQPIGCTGEPQLIRQEDVNTEYGLGLIDRYRMPADRLLERLFMQARDPVVLHCRYDYDSRSWILGGIVRTAGVTEDYTDEIADREYQRDVKRREHSWSMRGFYNRHED